MLHRLDNTFVITKNEYPYHVIPEMEEYADLLRQYEEDPSQFEEEVINEAEEAEKQKGYIRYQRDKMITSIEWRIRRYEQQKYLGLDTIDTEEEYLNILAYIQYLRDIPQSENFPDVEVKTYEEWKI